jgi:hypothetical protein
MNAQYLNNTEHENTFEKLVANEMFLRKRRLVEMQSDVVLSSNQNKTV